MNRWFFLLLSLVVFIADHVSKFLLKRNLPFGEEKEILPFFTIVHWQNRGGLWGFMGNASEIVSFILFLILPFIGIAFLIYLFLHSKNKIDLFLISVMIGGAFGNILDRILSGAVTDFLYFHLPSRSWSWPAFNIADACLSTSLTLFILRILFERKEGNAPDPV